MQVVPVDGDPVAVEDLRIGPEGVSALAGGKRKSWPLEDLAAVRFRNDGIPVQVAGPRLAFANGDVLGYADLAHATPDEFAVAGPAFGKASFKVVRLAGAALPRREGLGFAAADETRIADWLARPREGDAALLRNFDEAKGSFLGIDADELKLDERGKPTTIPRDRVLAVGFDPALAEKPAPKGIAVALRLRDGSRVTLRNPRYPSPALELRAELPGGPELTFDGAAVCEFAVQGGRALHLSDLKPARVVRQPFFDHAPGPRADANVRGGPLKVSDRVFAKGWGTASGTALAFPCDRHTRFECWVGVDDAAGPLASVRFLVKLDGRTAFDSGALGAGATPKPVRLELGGAKEILLEAEFAARGDIDDLADWCDARLVK